MFKRLSTSQNTKQINNNANKQFENLQKQRESNVVQSGKSSMNTFSRNIDSGYQSINVLKNKKRS